MSSSTTMTARLDRVGVYASALCFVHCLLTPVVLSFSAVAAHFLPTEEHTHRTLAVLVTLVGALALGTGYRRHKQRSILVLMAVGLAFIFFGAYFGDSLPNHWCEVAVTLSGGACMIAAHRKNHTFCQQCTRCQDPA
ncbi:MAG TPA: MerC domain-containing protein [Granulicella sp.]|jgi:carbon starvation protein CstA|nr:MerC domain-containing protein [Granulicella sp.]